MEFGALNSYKAEFVVQLCVHVCILLLGLLSSFCTVGRDAGVFITHLEMFFKMSMEKMEDETSVTKNYRAFSAVTPTPLNKFYFKSEIPHSSLILNSVLEA